MKHYPVSKSFLHRDALAHHIEQEYGLEQVNCQLISATLRDVYRVAASQGQYILYVYPHGQRSTDEIAAEWQWVDYLHGCGMPVAPAVPRTSGERLLTFLAPEGVRYGVLTQFVEGVILKQRSAVRSVRAYGRTIARMHVLSDQMPFASRRPAIDFGAIINQSVDAFEREACERQGSATSLRQAAERLEKQVNQLPKERPMYGMIHGDAIRSNALVTGDNRVTVIDFDFCGYGWRAYDVASYLHTIVGTPEEVKFTRAFLDGYQELRPLIGAEAETLRLFQAVRAIYSIGIPAMNMQHWGSQYFYSFVDRELAVLTSYMRETG